MKRTKPGFLLMEAMIGLSITIIGIMTLFWNIVESRKVTQVQERKVDYYLAASMMSQTNVDQTVVHDHLYILKFKTSRGVEIQDETTKQTIFLAK